MTKIAIIGCGKQAPKHISGLSKCEGVELILADRDPALAKALGEKEGLEWREDPQSVIDDPDVVAVDICTPTPSHYPLIMQALEAGKDFFVEKPLCDNSQQAREILKLTRERQRIGMVGYIYRFAPVLEVGKDIIGNVHDAGVSDVLGKVTVATMRIGGRGSHQVWKHTKETGGGAISEMLVHMLDLAVWYFGPVKKAELMVEELRLNERKIQGEIVPVDAEDYVVAHLETQSGVQVLIQADLLTPSFQQFVEVQGANGSYMGSIIADMPAFVFCIEDTDAYPAGKTNLEVEKANLFERQMATFAEAVRTRVEPERCMLEDSVHTIETVELLRESNTRQR